MIIIPDIHGRTYWKEAVKQRKGDELILFLGDYLDYYPTEVDAYTLNEITSSSCLDNFKQIIDFARKDNRVVLLLGNHDCEYIYEECPCCRMDDANRKDIVQLFVENKDLFRLTYREKIEDKTFVFSHAGINPNFLCQQEVFEQGLNGALSVDYYDTFFVDDDKIISYADKLNEMYENENKELGLLLGQVGANRGGRGYGSPIWCDYNEMYYYQHFFKDEKTNVYQVLGHSQYNPIVWKEHSSLRINQYHACLDCRCAFRLYYHEDESVDFLPITKLENAIYQKLV